MSYHLQGPALTASLGALGRGHIYAPLLGPRYPPLPLLSRYVRVSLSVTHETATLPPSRTFPLLAS